MSPNLRDVLFAWMIGAIVSAALIWCIVAMSHDAARLDAQCAAAGGTRIDGKCLAIKEIKP